MDVSITVLVGENSGTGTPCGSDNFGTMYYNLPGQAVRVTDEAGTVVGSGNVPQRGVVVGSGDSQGCKFDFNVPLLGDASFYEFDFGEFGKVTKSKQELDASGWTVFVG